MNTVSEVCPGKIITVYGSWNYLVAFCPMCSYRIDFGFIDDGDIPAFKAFLETECFKTFFPAKHEGRLSFVWI